MPVFDTAALRIGAAAATRRRVIDQQAEAIHGIARGTHEEAVAHGRGATDRHLQPLELQLTAATHRERHLLAVVGAADLPAAVEAHDVVTRREIRRAGAHCGQRGSAGVGPALQHLHATHGRNPRPGPRTGPGRHDAGHW